MRYKSSPPPAGEMLDDRLCLFPIARDLMSQFKGGKPLFFFIVGLLHVCGIVAFDNTVVSWAGNALLFANFKMHFCSIFHVMLLPQSTLLICVGLDGDLLLMLYLFYFLVCNWNFTFCFCHRFLDLMLITASAAK